MGSSIFPPTQNPWGSMARNTPADPALASRRAVDTGSSAGLGQRSLSSKQLISQTCATQRLKPGLVKTLLCLCSSWPVKNRKGCGQVKEMTGRKMPFQLMGPACV